MGRFKDDVVYLNRDGQISVSYFYFPEDERQPIRYYADGTKVPAPSAGGPSHFIKAKSFTDVSFYADGSLKTFETQNADGSHLLLNFASATESGPDGTVTFGGNNLSHGKLTSSNYTSPDQAHLTGNETPFQLIQTYTGGHLTEYQAISLSNVSKASLVGTYSLADHTSTLKLTTANSSSPFVFKGTGQIDGLVKFRAETLISQDGGGLISQDGGGFTLKAGDGTGLISQDGGGLSVISINAAGVKSTTALISQDGGGLSQLDVNALISQDGGGLLATRAGTLISQDGGGIVSHDAGGIVSHDAGGLLGLGLNGGALLAGLGTQLFGNTGASIVSHDAGGFSAFRVESASTGPVQGDFRDTLTFFASGSRSYQALLDKGAATPVDLTITTAFLGSATAHLGDTLNVSWQVKNLGPGAADASTSKIYLSKDKSTTTHGDDILIGSEVDPSLVNGAASSDTYDYKLPDTLTPGTYYVYVVANGAGQFTESGSQANNYSSLLKLDVSPVSPMPDLSVVSVILGNSSTSPASGSAGSNINVSYGIKEGNQVAAGASTSKVYLSTDATITADDILIGSLPESAIGAGSTRTSGGDFQLPGDLSTGDYYVGVIVDANGQVAESNEANNASSGYAIHVTGRSGPDLRVDNLVVNGTAPNPGGYASVEFDVTNSGTRIVRDSNTSIYLSKDATLSSDDILLRSYDEGLIENGSFKDENFGDLMIPDNTAPGNYYVIVKADADGGVSETNENNNTAAAQLTIAKPLPDLAFFTGPSSVALASTKVAAGGSDSFSFYVTNSNGKAAAPASHTRIYLSTDATIDASDTVLATVDTPVLQVQTTADSDGHRNYDFEDVAFDLPSTLKPGTYYIGAVTDYQGYVDELNEANNVSGTVKVTVTGPKAPTVSLDAVATDGTVNLAEMKAGIRVTGTTTGVTDGQTVAVTLKTAKGAVLGSAKATVHDDTFTLMLPKIDPTSLVAHGAIAPTGSFSVSASVTDDLGTAGSITKGAKYDFQPPVLAVVSETVTVTAAGYTVTLAGTSDLNAAGSLAMADHGTAVHGYSAGPGGKWTATFSTLSSASDHSLTMIGYDAAGNATQTPVVLTTKGASIVKTGAGNDTLTANAKAGHDQLYGGKGDDTYVIGQAGDIAYEKTGEGTRDLVKASVSYGLAGQDIENLTLTGHAAIAGTGNALGNTIIGNDKANVIAGGLGNDFLTGGAGQDTFVFNTKPSAINLDHITDFSVADDTIRVEKKGFGLAASIVPGALHEDAFANVTSAKETVGANLHFLYDKGHGTLYYDADGGSSAGRVAFAILDNHPALTFHDIFIV